MNEVKPLFAERILAERMATGADAMAGAFSRFEAEARARAAERVCGYVSRMEYRKPGVELWAERHEDGAVLVVRLRTRDSVSGARIALDHRFPVPTWVVYFAEREDADEFERVVRRWVLDSVIAMETHEAMEHLVVDGRAPFFPDHSRAYEVRELPRDQWHEVAEPVAEPVWGGHALAPAEFGCGFEDSWGDG
jgi:hypothetical protein